MLLRSNSKTLQSGSTIRELTRDPSGHTMGRQVRDSARCIAILSDCVRRQSMSKDHIHPPLVAGIYGRSEDGARSVVLAGAYDDEDNGDTLCVSYIYLTCN